jgi:hypothetical protein
VLRRHRKKLIGAAIVLFWLLMMGLLGRREILPLLRGPSLSTNYPTSPTDSWMMVLSPGEQPLGFINTQTAPETRDGLPGTLLTLNAILKMQFLGQPMRMHLGGSAWFARTGDAGRFDFAVRSEEHSARFEGVLGNGVLNARIHTAGEVYPLSLPVNRELAIAGIAGTSALQLDRLKPGEEAVIEAFDPMTLSMGTARVKCLGFDTLGEGDEARKVRVVSITSHNIESKAWLDEEGQTLRAETPLGLILQQTSSSEALSAVSREVPQDLIQAVAIHPSGKRPVRGANLMRIRISGIPDAVTIPEDANQRRTADGDLLIAPRSQAEDSASTELPENLEPFLAAHPFVQSDHPEIQRTATEIVEDRQDPWDKARAIYEWVFANIEKQGVLSIPSALDVLHTKVGDCNEHTVLFTALARAAGVPARMALGVVWSDELDGFYYHAWPEVYAGEWLWMEPTLGQPIADATHVKLLTGDIERWPRLLAFLGKLRIEVLEVSGAAHESPDGERLAP